MRRVTGAAPTDSATIASTYPADAMLAIETGNKGLWLSDGASGWTRKDLGATDPSLPSGAIAQTIPGRMVTTLTGTLTSGVPRYLGLIRIPAFTTVTGVAWYWGSSGCTTATHQWVGLWDTSNTNQAISADNTGATKTANTKTTQAFSATWTPTVDTIVSVVLCVVATSTMPTMPALIGGSYAHMLEAPIAAGTSASTGQTTPNATISAPSTGNAACYAWVY